jgi:hypothetical protein
LGHLEYLDVGLYHHGRLDMDSVKGIQEASSREKAEEN